jgi:hypothetical protein
LFFRLLFVFDAIIAAVIVLFFVGGVADGSVSSFNILLWVAILGALAAILGGSLFLNAKDNRAAAIAVLLLLAIPGLLLALFLLAVLVLQPRWN